MKRHLQYLMIFTECFLIFLVLVHWELLRGLLRLQDGVGMSSISHESN